MSKVIDSLILVCAFFLIATSVNGSVRFFDGSLEDAMSRAAAEHKCLYLLCSSSECMPCRIFERHVLTDSTVDALLAEHFVAWKADITDETFRQHRAEWKLIATPTHLFFSPEGVLVHRYVGGAQEPYALYIDRFIEQCTIALTPGMGYYAMLAKYTSSNYTKDDLLRLAVMTKFATVLYPRSAGPQDVDPEPERFFREYQSDVQLSDLKDRAIWNDVKQLTYRFDDPVATLVVHNRDTVARWHGDMETLDFFLTVASRNIESSRSLPQPEIDYTLSLLDSLQHLVDRQPCEEWLHYAGRYAEIYESLGIWDQYFKTIRAIAAEGKLDTAMIREVCWTVSSHCAPYHRYLELLPEIRQWYLMYLLPLNDARDGLTEIMISVWDGNMPVARSRFDEWKGRMRQSGVQVDRWKIGQVETLLR